MSECSANLISAPLRYVPLLCMYVPMDVRTYGCTYPARRRARSKSKSKSKKKIKKNPTEALLARLSLAEPFLPFSLPPLNLPVVDRCLAVSLCSVTLHRRDDVGRGVSR